MAPSQSSLRQQPRCRDCCREYSGYDAQALLLPCGHSLCRSCIQRRQSGAAHSAVCAAQGCLYALRDVKLEQLVTVGKFNDSAVNREERRVAEYVPCNDTDVKSEPGEAGPWRCGNCLQDFDIDCRLPKLLKGCSHVLCQSCLQGCRNACPECRTAFTGTAQSLPTVMDLIPNDSRGPIAGASGSRVLKAPKPQMSSRAQASSSEQGFAYSQEGKEIPVLLNSSYQSTQHKLLVDPDMKVDRLRGVVHEKTNVEPQYQQLSCQGRSMKSSNSLRGCGVRPNSTINMTSRLTGG